MADVSHKRRADNTHSLTHTYTPSITETQQSSQNIPTQSLSFLWAFRPGTGTIKPPEINKPEIKECKTKQWKKTWKPALKEKKKIMVHPSIHPLYTNLKCFKDFLKRKSHFAMKPREAVTC